MRPYGALVEHEKILPLHATLSSNQLWICRTRAPFGSQTCAIILTWLSLTEAEFCARLWMLLLWASNEIAVKKNSACWLVVHNNNICNLAQNSASDHWPQRQQQQQQLFRRRSPPLRLRGDDRSVVLSVCFIVFIRRGEKEKEDVGYPICFYIIRSKIKS